MFGNQIVNPAAAGYVSKLYYECDGQRKELTGEEKTFNVHGYQHIVCEACCNKAVEHPIMVEVIDWVCTDCGYMVTNTEYMQVRFDMLCPRCSQVRLSHFRKQDNSRVLRAK